MEAAGAGSAGTRGPGLPLVGGGLPGPGQPRAAHRLVPERAVLVDAAHSPQAAAGRRRHREGTAGTTRRNSRFPAADPGRAFPGGT